MRLGRSLSAAVIACGLASAGLANGVGDEAKSGRVSPAARLVAIRRAQVWSPTNVAMMDMTAGPQGPGAFAPNETVACEYVDQKETGASPKFHCRLVPHDEVKVKYRRDNGEVYGEVAATRLLWALGFFTDNAYPVRVVCRGCPPDPYRDRKPRQAETVFDPATIERKMPGHALETHEDSGWGWQEIDLVEETVGGAPVAQRDALKLLAVLLQHTDSRPAQQRLVCAPEEKVSDDGEPCLHTFMLIGDAGLTFGHANQYNRNAVSGVNFEQWAKTPVWSDEKRCVGNLPRSLTGTLSNPQIGEAGRKFLADLLVQLSDEQLTDLFTVARFPERTTSSIRSATVEEWVGAFKRKRDEILNRTCPA
jgi:hypothetical protein